MKSAAIAKGNKYSLHEAENTVAQAMWISPCYILYSIFHKYIISQQSLDVKL